MMRVKTIWVPCLFQAGPSFPLKGVENVNVLFFERQSEEQREFPWQQHYGCHLVSLVMYISGSEFEEQCFHISRDILYSVF